jgi:hypothetical protein
MPPKLTKSKLARWTKMSLEALETLETLAPPQRGRMWGRFSVEEPEWKLEGPDFSFNAPWLASGRPVGL